MPPRPCRRRPSHTKIIAARIAPTGARGLKRIKMLLIRSLLHMAWLLITVIPWGLALVLISLWVRRTPLWWFAVGWFRLVIWGTRVILGVRVKVHGMENLPQGATTPAILLSKHQSALETMLLP